MNTYDEAVSIEYARHRRVHPKVLQCLISTAKLNVECSVLEIGCGTGNYLGALEELVGCDCWGIDPSEAMLAEARKRSRRARLFCSTAESMSFSIDPLDLVFSVDVVHHLADRLKAFRECRRRLRPGGRLCLVTESETMIRNREPHATYFPEAVEVELARYPKLVTLTNELREAGFVDVTEQDVEHKLVLTDPLPYRTKVHSSLQLIPQAAFDRGITRLERKLCSGPITSNWRYALIWGINPPPFAV
jgi:SAM-dependent methyltransferase